MDMDNKVGIDYGRGEGGCAEQRRAMEGNWATVIEQFFKSISIKALLAVDPKFYKCYNISYTENIF